MEIATEFVGPQDYATDPAVELETCAACGAAAPAWMAGTHCVRRAYFSSGFGRTWHRRDPAVPFADRFQPTADGVWDMVKEQICCIDCGGWTDYSQLPMLTVTLGRITCAHCGVIVSP